MPLTKTFGRTVIGAAAFIGIVFFARGGFERVSFLQPSSPYADYVATLREAGLDRSTIGQQWIDAGRRILERPQPISTFTVVTSEFSALKPAAAAYRFDLHRGQRVVATLAVTGDAPVAVFADLFQGFPIASSDPVASAKLAGARLEYEPSEDGEFVLRVQPELLRGATIATTSHVRAALEFPVGAMPASRVQSLYGASRDGGRREHQGIDIFAPRGTPVVAAASGLVTSTAPNRLGGNVVWIWDFHRGQKLYYAHLDRVAVRAGQWVTRGEWVGHVGNTGNARNTSPHLHFGIYRQGLGPIDPLQYVVDPPDPASQSRRSISATKRRKQNSADESH